MSDDLVARVERACADIADSGAALTFAEVASRVGLSRPTLYRRTELRSIIEEHRARNRDAYSLSGIVIELDQLRQGLEAVAAKVRRHEEVLRDLQRRTRSTK